MTDTEYAVVCGDTVLDTFEAESDAKGLRRELIRDGGVPSKYIDIEER
jgi:hypothetical protein